MRKHILFLSLIVLVLVVLLLLLGLNDGFFWTIWWWDIPVHMLGGVWVGLTYAYIAKIIRWPATLLTCIAAAFFVGVGWELFEYLFHIGGSVFLNYAADTTKDLIDDCIGGAIAALILTRT